MVLEKSYQLLEITSETPAKSRYNFLSQYVGELGLKVSFDYIETKDFQAALKNAKIKYKGIRLGTSFFEEGILGSYKVPGMGQVLKVADSMVYEGKEWWPRCFTLDALHQIFVKKIKDVNVRLSGLVLGTNGLARLAVHFLVKIGFEKINIVGLDHERGRRLLEDFKRAYFGVEFEYLENNVLHLPPASASVVINCELTKGDLLNEVCYYNFLFSNGIVCELNLYPLESQMLVEASGVNVRIIEGIEVAALTDILWLKKLFPEINIDLVKYTTDWGSYLKSSVKD